MMWKTEHGFSASCEAIAKGMFDMMPDEYRSALAFGMLPGPLMQLAEEQFRETCVRTELRRFGIAETPETMTKWCAAVNQKVVSEFNHQLALAMLAEAKDRGELVV